MRSSNKAAIQKAFTEQAPKFETVDSTKIPVSLSAWLALTNTPAEIADGIEARMKAEINGGRLTGFQPYLKNGEIYFDQRWCMMIGISG